MIFPKKTFFRFGAAALFQRAFSRIRLIFTPFLLRRATKKHAGPSVLQNKLFVATHPKLPPMKKFILFAFLLFSAASLSLSAQEVKVYYGDPSRPQRKRNVFENYPRHEVSAGVGMGNINNDVVRYGFFTSDRYYYGSYNPSPPSQIFEDGGYYTDLIRSTYAFSGRYYYALNRVFQVGGVLSYYKAGQNRYMTLTREWESSAASHYISVIPTIRMNIVKRDLFSIYCSLGIGYGQYYRKDFDDAKYGHGSFVATDITFIGFTIGKKWFVGGELGLQTTGIIKLYAGYRF